MAFDFIVTSLQQRRSDSLYRQRQSITALSATGITVEGRPYINFASNDYLGLAQSDQLKQAWQDATELWGVGSGASPLVTGYSAAHQALECRLAEYLQREAVLLFNSGFAANQAICQGLMAQGGYIIADKLSHASIIDGALASNGKLQRFAHNDVSHLQRLMNKSADNKLVVTEGVFSMDGDVSPLKQVSQCCADHNAWLMVDDAHGFGVLGEQGMGSAELQQLPQNQLPVLMATFGKAVGTAGAFVAGSQELVDYLVNSARHYIYSTHMPAAQAVATLASIELIRSQSWRRDKLRSNIEYFKTRANQLGIALMPSDTAIQPVMVGDPDRALQTSRALKQAGFWVTAIRYPTVPQGTERLRITLSAQHEVPALDELLIVLAKVVQHGD
ncbi:8-amino-7-oxononanoate synthase [Neptunicella sp. SCSIO 80796]|uniref:8-amino-7-oxononanoate synthase n=1 Tax=Neptunicella plasticusilytica TaxID=3117012 RepID=UPI003A4DC53B